MKRAPVRSRSTAALAADGLGDQRALPARAAAAYSTVGWNCTNSRSAAVAPARSASATPSPVARRRVGGAREELAEAAGGQQHRRGAQHAEPAGVVEQRDAADRARRVGAQRVDGDVPGQQRQPAVAGGGDQRPLDLRAGGVAAGADHPERAVPALAGALERPAGGEVEGRAARPQPGDRGRARRPGSPRRPRRRTARRRP